MASIFSSHGFRHANRAVRSPLRSDAASLASLAVREMCSLPRRGSPPAALIWTTTSSKTTTSLTIQRRDFSSSPARTNSSATKIDIATMKVNPDRLLRDLHHTCQWGTGKPWGAHATETGMRRLALSDADKQVRDWFVETTRALGCDVSVDTMGNIFAVRKGMSEGAPTFAGSHLDTQPAGGRYDGILGVLAGVEMLKVLHENEVRTKYSIGVVNWTNEEGARFPISMVSSGVWAGAIPVSHAHALREVGGGPATMRSELARIGYLGTLPASHTASPMAAHFELHIEQGPVLEAEAQKIGVVRGVRSYRWYTVDVRGRESHTGTTPFANRADALLTAARMISATHDIAAANGALASTGILTLEPGSVNTVPGEVRFSLDVRASTDAVVEKTEGEIKEAFARLAANEHTGGLPLTWSMETDSVSPAIKFHDDCIAVVRASAESVTGDPALVRDMVSGAGHDSVYTSRHCPASMIFVPCRKGISHNPEEYTSPKDCAIGAEVLLQSVLRFDESRKN